MSLSDRFYVWRAEVWGDTHVWEIYERTGFKRRRVKTWKTEAAARTCGRDTANGYTGIYCILG